MTALPTVLASDALLDNQPTISGNIMVPLSWAWTAEVDVPDTGDATWTEGQQVTLTLNNNARVGTVVKGSSIDLRYSLRIVGGAGGLDTIMQTTDYSGVSLDRVVGDVLQNAGEAVGDLTALNTVSLPAWICPQDTASWCLHRIMRLAPNEVYLRVGGDGKWVAFAATWPTVGANFDLYRYDSYPSEDALEVNEIPNYAPEPGSSMNVLGATQKIDRVFRKWEGATFKSVVWFTDGLSRTDRLRSAMYKQIRSIGAEDQSIDFRGVYGARVAKDGGSNGQIDVFVDDDLNRLQHVSGATLLRGVGDTDTLKAGSRVLVMWMFSDERYPVVLSASWSGGGGLASRVTQASSALSYVAPTVALGDTAGSASLDAAATKQDLLNLLFALNSAGGTSGVAVAALLQSTANWPAPTPIVPGFCSSVVGIKR